MTTSDNIAAISKALEGVTPGPWLIHEAVLGHKGDIFAPTAKRVTDCHHIARCFAPKPANPVICELQAIQVKREAIATSEANAAYIAACNPVAISALLAEARKAEAMEREIAEKDARIAALEEGVSDLVEIARQGVPSIPPDGPTSPEHQAAYEATGFTLVEIRSLARTLLNGEKS